MAEELTYYDKKYERGWYRNGKRYRFLYIVAIGNVAKYQTKTAYLRNWETMSCENLELHEEWFKEAEYLGLDLPFDESSS